MDCRNKVSVNFFRNIVWEERSIKRRLITTCLGRENIVFYAAFIEAGDNVLMVLVLFVECLICFFSLTFICAMEEFRPCGVCEFLSVHFSEVQVDVVDIHVCLMIAFGICSIKTHDSLFFI